jgi:hypothetical protein
MAIVMTVDFTVHILLTFLHAPDPQASAGFSFASPIDGASSSSAESLMKMAVPSMHGAITMFLGVVMLANADADFIRLYHFALHAMLVFFGVVNGLIVMSAVFVACGPVSTSSPFTVGASATVVPTTDEALQEQ